MKQCYSFRLW